MQNSLSFRLYSECTNCFNWFDVDTNCKCTDYYDISSECINCSNHVYIMSYFKECIKNYNKFTEWAICINKYSFSDNCEICNFDINTSCQYCMKNFYQETSLKNCFTNDNLIDICQSYIDKFYLETNYTNCSSE